MAGAGGTRTWKDYTMQEKKLLVTATYVAAYAKMIRLEKAYILVPGSGEELSRLKRWWNAISQQERDNVEQWVDRLPEDVEVMAGLVGKGMIG